ncbi:hypothetical protein [Nocardia cyriacigeorgica]|uniref:hypothetical protein n=1 Tax=Nocardia cyriacigeorgica TaxID=135487 RepID=UPI001F3811B7|nr:hypothetical protein [Nocardia cyriacigeorgica]
MTVEMVARYQAFHFSQANPKGPGQGDVAALLRAVADTVDELGAVSVSDVVLHSETTVDGEWPSITVYYQDQSPA